MSKRTRPDANQSELEEIINLCPGCRFVDTHNVPVNLPELAGFPDGLVISENALTIICDDPAAVVDALRGTTGIVRVMHGGIVPVEIKTERGELRASQEAWGRRYGVRQVVVKTIKDVSRLFGLQIRGGKDDY